MLRIYPEPRTAIAARRRELNARAYVPRTPAPVTVQAAPRRHTSAFCDAVRNATLVALVVLALVACVCWR